MRGGTERSAAGLLFADDWAELWGADTPQAMWQVLVQGGRHRTPNHPEAIALLRKHHGEGQDGAFDSALLLCTYRRWERCSARVIADMAASRLLGENDLNRLAAAFLCEDKVIYDYPARWVGSKLLEIDVATGRSKVIRVPPDTPLRYEALVPPPLRRWAAARILRRQPDRVEAVLERAHSLDPPAGAAVVMGMLDAIGSLAPEDVGAVLEYGLSWPLGKVRLQALKLLAASEGPEPAIRRAAVDPDAGVRAWRPGPRKTGRSRGVAPTAAGEPASELSWQEDLFSGE